LGLSPNRKPATGKPNIDNRGKKKCDCKKWEINRYDRTCEGHVPGVGYAKYFRDPQDDLWYSSDKTGHDSSTFKVFSSTGGVLDHKADLDEFGDYINKHKGISGEKVDLKKLKCKDLNP